MNIIEINIFIKIICFVILLCWKQMLTAFFTNIFLIATFLKYLIIFNLLCSLLVRINWFFFHNFLFIICYFSILRLKSYFIFNFIFFSLNLKIQILFFWIFINWCLIFYCFRIINIFIIISLILLIFI